MMKEKLKVLVSIFIVLSSLLTVSTNAVEAKEISNKNKLIEPEVEINSDEKMVIIKDPSKFWNDAGYGAKKLGFPFAGECLINSAGPIRAMGVPYTAKDLYFSPTGEYANKIKSTKAWKTAIENAKNYFKGKTGNLSKEYVISVEASDNADVFLALHNFTVKISVKNKPLNGNYTMNVNIYDYYDFDKSQVEYGDALGFIVNKAYAHQELGLLKNYNIYINGITVSANDSSNGYPGTAVRYGSTGSIVTKVQQRLNSLGFTLSSDGSFGSATDKAVKNFQRTRGISVDGSVGPTTWDYLFNRTFKPSYPGTAVHYGSTGTIVLMVQARLNQLGYNLGAPDGSFGPATKNAVLRFQKSKGLSQDGYCGPATWSKLFP